MSKAPDLFAQHTLDILMQEKHEVAAAILKAQLMAVKLDASQKDAVSALIAIAETRLFDVRRELEQRRNN